MTDAASLTREHTRTIAADAGIGELNERVVAAPVTMAPMFLRYDPTHELPHVVEDERGRTLARFKHPGDLAIFVSRDHQTLPRRYVALIEARS